MHGHNKAIISRAVEEYLVGQCEEVFRELFAPHCVAGGPDVGAPNDGMPVHMSFAAFRDHSLMYKSAFPDMEFRVDEIIEEGDRVAARWTVRGGDCGNSEAVGIRRRVAPGTQQFSASGVAFCRLHGGRIVEIWQLSDLVTLLKRFGCATLGQEAAV